MAQITKFYRAEFHCENIPKFLEKKMTDLFVKNRSKAVAIFNRNIGAVNDAWDQVGEPAAFGNYAEDINPNYVQFIIDAIQPSIDELNKTLNVFNYYKINEVGDIVGYSPILKDSKIWVTLRPM